MKEVKNNYNFEKQEARRFSCQEAEIIYNIAGDLIVEHPKTGKTIYIPTIQTLLRKEETSEGDLFKKEPVWIDFKNDYIIQRKEVSEIIKNIKSDTIQIVLGEPASGKTVILKNVGFKLANENKDVYFVELKKYSREDVKLIFENISNLIDENSIFIVDDVHLYLLESKKLIKDYKIGNLIVGSRKIKEITEDELKETSVFESLRKTCIQSEDVSGEMIRKFLKEKHHFSEDRIKTVSSNFEKYKKDLWILSWALNTYSPHKNFVDESEIYKNVRDSIRKIKYNKDDILTNFEDVFLPLSVFSKFEIQIERDFLVEHLGVEEEIIEQLIGLSEVIETEELGKPRMLSLNHSSIAKLYLVTYQKYPSLGKRIKNKIINGKDEENLEFFLFQMYMIITSPRNSIDIIYRFSDDVFNRRRGRTLINKLIEDNNIQESIKKGVKKEDNIEKIGKCIKYIAFINKEVGIKLINHLDIRALLLKIENEEDVGKIGSCIMYIEAVSKDVGIELVNHLDICALLVKIENEDDIQKIGECVAGIGRISKELGLKLVKNIENDILLKIEKQTNINKILWGLILINEASSFDVVLRIVAHISETKRGKVFTKDQCEELKKRYKLRYKKNYSNTKKVV